MNVWHLVLREIFHRKLNFAQGLFSVTVAVACFVGALTLLEAHKWRTEELLAAKRTDVEQAVSQKQRDVALAGKRLEDSMRKITKGLGFNILILPKDQDLNELHVEGSLSKTMPEEYVNRLANSKIVTINHLLPMVTKKIQWKNRNQTILLTGTRGEVPIMHRGLKKPLLDAVPAGTMAIGYQVHKQQKLSKGDKVTLLDNEFTVKDVYPSRGTADDSTVWINLREAQELLKMENLVNAILALECNCATADRVTEIRSEIQAILPGTQVVERGPPALARAEARNQAKKTAVNALERERADGQAALTREAHSREDLRRQREKLASVLLPLVLAGCAVWIGFLTLTNVRERSTEIGILRAIGLRSVQIFSIFLGKALLIGLLGAAIGCLAGFGIGLAWSESQISAESSARLFAPQWFLLAVAVALLLSGLASWIPAMLAARQDPAVVLQGD